MESTMGVMTDLLMKIYSVEVAGWGTGDYYAASPGKARAAAWRGFPCDYSFKDFLRVSRVTRQREPENFGEPILVGGEPAYRLCGANNYPGQYVCFARPGGEIVYLSHPADVTARPSSPCGEVADA